MPNNPFAASASLPGQGVVKLSLLQPSSAVLETLSYQYPLKLIAPAAARIEGRGKKDGTQILVHTVFLLTYGGGLVAGDSVTLNIHLARTTRLVLLTQGSTKIFKSPGPEVITRQHTVVEIGEEAALCYLPDPVQPFETSVFEQRQTYNVTSGKANLCVCDWVSEGRPARGERWSFTSYASRNEVWLTSSGERKRLLLRDNVVLDSNTVANHDVIARMESLGVFGTLIICGPMFERLAGAFKDEFHLLPRIGSRQWDALLDPSEQSLAQRQRVARIAQEVKDEVLWTVADTRGFCVIKFGAREVEGAKRWLRSMISAEGTVEREFGERALLCLR